MGTFSLKNSFVTVLLLAGFYANAQLAMVRSTFTGPYVAIDTPAATLSTATGDDGFQDSIPLGFTFTYLGNTYTTIGVNTNGAASFTDIGIAADGSNSRANANLFSVTVLNNTLAPWWDDLDLDGTLGDARILYLTQGTPGSQTFTLQWTNVASYFTTSTTLLNFQIVLHEGTNVIEFKYGPVTAGAVNTSESASVGIENATGGAGNYIDGVTGSSFTGNGMLNATNMWPVRHIRFTPGTPVALSGTFSVGTGQTYPTLDEAIADVNHRGVSGPVTFNLTDALYSQAPAGGDNIFPLLLGPVAGTSSTNTLTIQAANTATLSSPGTTSGNVYSQTSTAAYGTGNEPVLGIVGGQYITIDNLNFTTTATGVVDRGVSLINSSATLGSQFNTIKNVSVSLQRSNTSSVGIEQRLPTSPTATTGANSENDFENLTISNVYNGIQLTGNATYPDLNCTITNTLPNGFNSIGGAGANDIGNGTSQSWGIRATSQSGVVISRNEVRNVTASGALADGILVETAQGICGVYGNKVHDITGASTSSTSGVTGIRANVATTGTHNLGVWNNFVYGIKSNYTGGATATRQIRGIYVQSAGSGAATSNIAVDFNSVLINSPALTGSSTCFEIGTTSGPIMLVRNNIFVNATAAQTGVAGHYCWASTSATAIGNTGSVSNYNDLYIADAGQGFVGRGNTTTYATLGDWQTATTQDANSVSADPGFTSATDLHAALAAVNNSGNLTGILWVTDDIDGEARNPLTPDMGADEFTPPPLDVAVDGLVAPLTGNCYGATENIIVAVRNAASSPHSFVTDPTVVTVNVSGAITQTLTYTISNNTLNFGNPLSSQATLNIPVGLLNMSASGTYVFDITVTTGGDPVPGNDTLPTVTIIWHTPVTITASSDSICTGESATLTTNGTFSNNTVYPVPDLNPTGATSAINVSGFEGVIGAGTITSICMNLTQTYAADFDIYLISPEGTQIELSTDNGGSGDNYTNTCFSPTAVTNIAAGIAPFTGSYLPEGNLNNLNGENAAGVWTLKVVDDASGDTGDILDWSISFNVSGYGYTWSSNPSGFAGTGTTEVVSPTASTTYYVTVTNPTAGCNFQDSINITVSTPPVVSVANANITCNGDTATLDAGNAGSSFAWSTGGTTQTIDVTAAGTYHVTVTSATGCSATDSATVSVNDNILPTAVCQSATVYLDGAGNAIVNALDIDNGSTDNCGIASWAVLPATFTCAQTGAQAVTLTVTDSSGNIASCNAQVTVLDTVAPAISCPGNITVNNDPGLCGAVVTYNTPTVTENCNTNTAPANLQFSYTGSPQTWTVPAGVTEVTVEAWGAQGQNAASGGTGGLGAYVKGTISVTPGQVLQINVGGQNGYNGGGIGGLSGNTDFSLPPSGINGGNGGGASDVRTGTYDITERELVAGGGGGGGHDGNWVGCQPASPAGNGGGGSANTGSSGTAGSSTACNCGGGGGGGGTGGTQSAGGLAGNYAGSTACLRVTWTIGSDGALGLGGNGSVTYHNGTGGGGGGGGGYYGGGSGANGSDTTPGGGGGGGSSYTGAATNVLTADGTNVGDGMVMLSWQQPVPLASTQIAGLASGSTFPVGVTTNTFVATDASGNTDTCSFTVTVTDNQAPTLSSGLVPEVLYYKFDGTGTSVPNLAGNPPAGTATATLLGAANQGGTGQCGGAILGTGTASTGDYLNTGWAPDLGTGAWTISFWTSGITGTSTLYYIFGDVNTSSFRCFTNGVAGANNWILRGAGLSDVLVSGAATATPSVTTFVYDPAVNNVKAYLNGVLVNTVAQTAPNLTGAGPFKVNGYSTNVGLPVGGAMDEFSIYNRALSAQEVALLALNCQGSADSVQLYATAGNCGVTHTFSAPSANDNCPGATVTQIAGLSSGSVFPLGETRNVFVATDAAGLTDTLTTLVTVLDTLAPTAICQNITAYLDGSGNVTITEAMVNNGSNDNCGIASMAVTPTTFSCADIGTQTVTLTVTDSSGNVSTCQSTVTVADTVGVVITCQTDVTVNTDAGQCSAVVTYTSPTASDNCSSSNNSLATTFAGGNNHRGNMFDVTAINNLTISGFDAHPMGNTTIEVYYRAGSYAGFESNSAGWTLAGSAAVTAQPTGTPTPVPVTLNVNIPAGQTYAFYVTSTNVAVSLNYTDGNAEGAVFTADANLQFKQGVGLEYPFTNGTGGVFRPRIWNGNIHYTLGPPITITQVEGLASGSVFPVGTTTNTFVATDGVQTDTCRFNVTVIDAEAPAITCPADIAAGNDAGVCGAVITYNTPAATDNCTGVTVNQIEGLASGSTFPVGVTTNTFVATDASGNADTCSFLVTITDTEAPAVTCGANVAVNADAGNCNAVVTYNLPTFIDNCPGATLAQIEGLASGGAFPLGVTTNTFVVTDAAGNADTCSFTVTVTDAEAPTITCPAAVTVNADAGNCTAANVVLGTATTADNCGIDSTTNDAPAVFAVGTTTVTWTTTDVNGNTNTCTQTVTVVDAEVPVVSCPANITTCNPVVTFAATATDNCGVDTITYSHQPGSTFAVGTTTVTVTATDDNGNTATCTFDVTVNASPVVSLGPDVSVCSANVTLDAGNAGATYAWSTTATTQTITVTANGNYSVTVTSQNGCSAADTITVTLRPVPVVNLGADATACSGSTVTLDAGNQGSTFAWSNSTTAQTLSVTTNGTYSVTVTSVNGCTAADTVNVTFNATPVVNLGADVTQCGGSVALDAGNAGSSFAWNTTQSSQIITVTTGGTYTVTVTNSSNCSASDAVVVTINALPSVALSLPFDTLCSNGSAVNLGGGQPTGGTYSGTGVSGSVFNPATAGAGTHTITYSVTGANGCIGTATDVVVVEVCSGVEEVANGTITLYPNPATNYVELKIDGLQGALTLQMFDMMGQLVITETGYISGDGYKQVLDVTNLSAGTYLVRVNAGAAKATYTLVVQQH